MHTAPSKPIFFGALVLLLTPLFAAGQGMLSRTAADLKSLQGHWEGHGPGGECSVTISGKSLIFHAREDFWYETTFQLPADTNPPQLHATIIKDSTAQERDIGKVVVAVFKFEDESLTLGVINSFDEPPVTPLPADWDSATDRYVLKRAQPPEKKEIR